MKNKIITTSWDDGHPLDWRIAELLDKYNLKGTFYIPKVNHENSVMKETEIKTLSESFEVGGHTINHISANHWKKNEFINEAQDCFKWLNYITGKNPVSFCLPYGHSTSNALEMIYAAGFKIVRTTVLLSPFIKYPLTDTTIQVYNHSTLTLLKHLTKRKQFESFWLWLKSGCSTNSLHLIDHYLNHIDRNGGCFHVWGHSWEIEKYNLWKQLETILQHLSKRSDFQYISNSGLLDLQQQNK